MNVCFASYQSVMMLKGGPRTQILQTRHCLEQLGVKVSLFESWRDLEQQQFDLIHLFGANIGTYHLAREIHKLGIPLVVTPIFFTRRSPFLMRAVVSADRFLRNVARGTWTDYGLVAEICRWATRVLPNTFKEALLIERGCRIPREKIIVVPNGVDGRFAHADPSLFVREFGVDRFILNVGHIGPARKNVLRLIAALETINAPAVIIGRIETTEYGLRCQEEAKRNPRLRILGHLPNDSPLLASAYAAADVFVLPSMFETPGIAALEAGLAGAKIVITKYGGTEQYFGNHAEYVEPTSCEFIHHGITTALNKMKNGELRDHIRQNYLWERVGEKTLDAYLLALEDFI